MLKTRFSSKSVAFAQLFFDRVFSRRRAQCQHPDETWDTRNFDEGYVLTQQQSTLCTIKLEVTQSMLQ